MTVDQAPSSSDASAFGSFSTDAIGAKAESENFPVALRVLPADIRGHLEAIYRYARFIDDLGDRLAGDRLAALDRAQLELDAAFDGAPSHPVFADIVATVNATAAERAPLDALIDANRLDQRKARYATYEELLAYCALSANPVGRLVLGVFGTTDDHLVELSDQICTGLQIVEHLQDIGEDARDGRIYFPKVDLDRFGVGISDLVGTDTAPGLRRLVAFESSRAKSLIESGLPLVAHFTGVRRLALAGFAGGGLAQLAEIERREFDVLGSLAKASKRAVITSTARIAIRAARRAR